MLHRDEAALAAYLADRPSRAVLVLRDTPDDETAMAALRAAAAAVRAIPHPGEPTDPLPNWVDALLGDDGPALHLDLQDHAEQAPRVVAAALSALDASGVPGCLEPLRPPAPPYEYDANAHILTDVTFLESLDERGLPPAFPDGFPGPAEAVMVLAQQCKSDTWQHAAWRRTNPFTEYPEVLRAFGCELELVTARDALMTATGMTRHLIRHPTGSGSVSCYHEYGAGNDPNLCYVSVVWRPSR
ncbi:hypothetical protein GCM10010172_67290 [Paractinoplanes ferrugineus]|uniref:Uncharacterized protein n=1 Tax=Paractinoplanes ferrugineus TaxID=113564 RepID=A0A919MHY1_9ACTN|nr:hypothetical protein [Actinoplanes ferrugineus]GIE13110.1 hypothetical protein Afe05nite_49500 [Actinoplanes ferrugineus]